MYVDHKKARKSFETIVSTEPSNWITICGGDNSGKTSFIKEVCLNSKTLFCSAPKSLFYLDGLICELLCWQDVCIKQFFREFPKKFEPFKEFLNINFVNEIPQEKYAYIVRKLILNDIENKNYHYAFYLGNVLSNITYIVLDDFYKCDRECYEWLLYFSESFLKRGHYIIILCDNQKEWESTKIRDIVFEIPELVDIQYFDAATDFETVLSETIFFDNEEQLKKIAKNLFKIYKGKAQLLFETIRLYGNDNYTNDVEREKHISEIANRLSIDSILYKTKTEQLILELLALCPIPLSKLDICALLEMDVLIVAEVLHNCINANFLELIAEEKSIDIRYTISDDTIQELILINIAEAEKNFLLNRIWILGKSGKIGLDDKSYIDVAFSVRSSETEALLVDFLNDASQNISQETKIDYINYLYSLNLNKKHIFSNYQNAKKAYEFGFFETALKMLTYMKNSTILDYNFYMLLGGVQHLLLQPEASQTFKKASEMEGITTSQKLSAINRQIMSLNQADETCAYEARQLYERVLNEYSNEKCVGLIQLYRNTNNSFPMDQALEYTIKGYQLATELGEELERYTCMHNICMIQLHQNMYPKRLERKELDMEPSFEIVDNFFRNNAIYCHKRAYPLLDLGTYEMFKFITTKEIENLKRAKTYYSKAQLFAKSFYARHIAECSLLVVNTHLYLYNEQILQSVRRKRKSIFQRYNSQQIIDCRVNRKILLSLAVSAVLTKDLLEAKKYLDIAQEYISGPEKNRYDNLRKLCTGGIVILDNNEDFYYSSPEFVPWLISLAH